MGVGKNQMINQHRRNTPHITVNSSISGEIDLSALCLSVMTHKDVSNVAGSFEIVLADAMVSPDATIGTREVISSPQQFHELMSLIRKLDTVSIGFQKRGGTMLGVVEEITLSEVFRNGSYQTSVTIKGRDFG